MLAAFPKAFREGPALRAKPDRDDGRDVGLGDVGPSAPEHWIVGAPHDADIHIVISLYARADDRLKEVSERLETGMIGLNQGIVSNPAAPFGGIKHSGYGREGGAEGIEEYLETKYVGSAL